MTYNYSADIKRLSQLFGQWTSDLLNKYQSTFMTDVRKIRNQVLLELQYGNEIMSLFSLYFSVLILQRTRKAEIRHLRHWERKTTWYFIHEFSFKTDWMAL